MTQQKGPAAAAVRIAGEVTAEVLASVAGMFSRVEPRRHASSVVAGLQSQLETKNCWTLAQYAGHADPWRLQHFFNEAKWDEDGLRDRVAAWVWGHISDRSERVLVFDETGDVKKGDHTPGVRRQYTGTAGRIENAQVAVYAAWVSGSQRALVDYELFLPTRWSEDSGRRQGAGIPEEVAFSSKVDQARQILARRLSAGEVPSAIAADALYGRSTALRADAEEAGISYVLEVGANTHARTHPAMATQRVDALAQAVPTRQWADRSAGRGSKGHRTYTWAYLALDSEDIDGERGLLIRVHPRTNTCAYYLTYQPSPTLHLTRLIKIAGMRWSIETCFQETKGHHGLDEHQMRTWKSLRRWITLCLTAAATIAIAHHRTQGHHLTQAGLTRLYATLTRPRHPPSHHYHWSQWITHHNETAQKSHYQRHDHYP